ncbi:MAG: hypothetical protein AVDCRST_MAG95-2258 [uncultured Adhaeribacter sp.]|uniref:Uncharacterized protein n=1 Tax=uncultured Adhaeribacter sp. TaxID=448109 RepID=A0A6J4IUV7_9BACT|nr:MAG: hypothetical protein AVDCRST_MAG95-2258 [uncultured Adhaeribacter sp.]
MKFLLKVGALIALIVISRLDREKGLAEQKTAKYRVYSTYSASREVGPKPAPLHIFTRH